MWKLGYGLNLLGQFHFESRAYYIVIILLRIGRLNLYTLPFSYFFQVLFYLLYIYFHSCVIRLSGDVEKNPGPKSKSDWSSHFAIGTLIASLCILFWKSNLLLFIILYTIWYYLSFWNILEFWHVIWKWEFGPSYRMVQSNHPSTDKSDGVCVYFKSSLPIQISISVLQECINLEITIDSKLCNLNCLFRSPSQNVRIWDILKNFYLHLEFILNENPNLIVVLGGVNAKSQNWYQGDKTIASGSKLEIMTSHYGLTQKINKPTQLLKILHLA